MVDLLTRVIARWSLRNVRPAPDATHDSVLFAETVDGAPVVVKLSRRADRLSAEVEALRAFGEQRAAKVIDVWLESGAVLLERVEPGDTLASHATEDEAMRIAAGVLARAWPPVPADSNAEPLGRLTSDLDRLLVAHRSASCPVDYRMLERASALFRELLDEGVRPSLLHGDLHYGNILTSSRAGHLLIDPKGLIGDPAFDVGYLASRPGPCARDAVPLSQAIDRRLAFLPGATGQDPARVAAFTFVASALSAAWAIEDGEPACIYDDAMAAVHARLR